MEKAKSAKKKEFLIPTDLSLIQKASAQVLDFLKPLELNEGEIFDIRLCLEEALINGMKYGNRLQKNLHVRIVAEWDSQRLGLTIEDQGSGFDPRKVRDCTKEENLVNLGGRGIYLIYKLMDKVEYNMAGNRLKMIKKLHSKNSQRN